MATPANPMSQPPAPSAPDPQAQQQPQGPSKALQLALWNLMMALELQDELARRREIRAILQRRLYWRNEQYWWWSEYQGLWFPPYEQPTGADSDNQQPEFQHVTNIFQAFSSLLMSVLSQHTVPAQFWPQSPSDEQDQQTAKQASKVIDYIHRNNNMDVKADDATYFMCTDGFMGNYIRYVSDGEQFGYDEMPVLDQKEVQISAGGLMCPSCGYFEESGAQAPVDSSNSAQPPTSDAQPSSVEDQALSCPQCGEAMEQLPPMSATVPVPTGQTEQIPRGQEVMTVVPALELKRSMWANEQKDFLYLTWITDLHCASASALYPQLAVQFKSSGGGSSGPGTAGDTYERLARRLLYVGSGRHAGADIQDLGVFRRAWLRPRSFWKIDDDALRIEAMKLYPQGVKAVFFNEIFCEAQPEGMDDCWETMQTMPGEGQFRETLTSSLIPIQDQLNDCSNLEFEIGMHGVPEGFADGDVVDFEARDKQTALPGQMTEINLERNEFAQNKIIFSPAVEPSVALSKYRMELFTLIPQFLCGGSPALAGGDTGDNDTASGIAIQRNQALGRIGRAWRRLQTFWCNSDAKAVRCFAKNRKQDVELAVLGDGGDFQTDLIQVDQLKGNLQAFPEVDQQYPVLQAELRGLLLSLMQGPSPLAAVAMSPDNLGDTLRRLGLTELEEPGADQKRKTYLDIEQMLQPQPQPDGSMAPAKPVLNQQGVLLPTLQPDPVVDRLDVAKETARKWLLSEKGLAARKDQPGAYANVRLYMQACDMMMKGQQMQQALAAAGASGSGTAADLGGAEDVVPPEQGGAVPGKAGKPGAGAPPPSESSS